MNAKKVKHCLTLLNSYIPPMLPSTAWYFSERPPTDAIMPEKNEWTCMFSFLQRLTEGDKICYTSGRAGCTGAACYLGFSQPSQKAGYFLAKKEKFKKSVEFGNAFYEEISEEINKSKCLVWQSLEDIVDDCEVEVVNLWVNADCLAGLVTLANYDSVKNDNVLIPFSSGCQSIWAIPFGERGSLESKCVVGCIDPVVRKYISQDTLSISMLANRFVEMVENIEGSFLKSNDWKAIKTRNLP